MINFKNMKKLYFLAVLTLISCIDVSAQQDPHYTQYMYNLSVINPAYAGSKENLSMGLLYRKQWVEIQDAPTTGTFFAHSPVGKNVGIGLSAISDKIGPVEENNVYGDFSYTLNLGGEHRLAFGLKAGATLKINGRNYIYANVAYLTRAPYFDNVYSSPRTRNTAQDQISVETITSFEAGYTLTHPTLKLRLTGYYTNIKDGMDIRSFYHDDYRNFVNYATNNIGKNYQGIEIGIEKKVLYQLSINAIASIGDYRYTTKQTATVTQDNSTTYLDKSTIYAGNYYIGGSPQQAYSLGAFYRHNQYWMIGIASNWFSKLYLDINPIRRTYAATDGLEASNPKRSAILDQTTFPTQQLLNLFTSYRWKTPRFWGLKKYSHIVYNLGINNLLNNKSLVNSGYEQLRFDFSDRNVAKFPPKLLYAFGITYTISASLQF
jgi:type IX secretion system PorP/SprF family membrane protein